MTTNILKYSLWTILILSTVGLLGYIVFINTFDIFETPDKKVISYKCDSDGLRQVELIQVDGNATTNNSIIVSVTLDCKDGIRENEINILTADKDSYQDNDIKINWTTVDTLTIEYKRGLKIINKEDRIVYSDSKLNFAINYKILD